MCCGMLKEIIGVILLSLIIGQEATISSDLSPHSTLFTPEDRSYLSAEVKKFVSDGTFNSYFKSLVKHYKIHGQIIRDNHRKMEIIGFICAASLLRVINHAQYLIAHKNALNARHDPRTKWEMHLEGSNDPVIRKLRDPLNTETFMDAPTRGKLAQALALGYKVFSAHIHDGLDTVQIISQFRKGKTETLLQMLANEKVDNLITQEDMDLINKFVVAADFPKFPYLTLQKGGRVYAIPVLQKMEDLQQCPKNLCGS